MIKKIGRNTHKPYISVYEPITNSTLLSLTTASAQSIGTYLTYALTEKYSAASSPAAQVRASVFDEKLADFDADPILTCA